MVDLTAGVADPAGPATLPALKSLVSIAHDDTDDDRELDRALRAANEIVTGLPIAQDGPPWGPRVVQGALLLAARLFERRNSPGGVYTLAGAEGAVYVSRNDPDIAQLLEIGAYIRPKAR